MNSLAKRQIYSLQKSLYEKVYLEAKNLAIDHSAEILSYQREFNKTLPAKFKRVSLTEILLKVHETDLMLFGDFHTLRQSQRAFVKLIQQYLKLPNHQNVIIALEVFCYDHQSLIDSYLQNKLTDKEFLAQIQYCDFWGFPWQNYKIILDFAKKHRLKVFGINSFNYKGLIQRDKYSAKILLNLHKQFPDHKIICLIGEYHLANAFLPKMLNELVADDDHSFSYIRFINNIDRYFFALKQTNPATVEHLQLSENIFSIMNTPPWLKWRTFTIWEESRDHDSDDFLGLDGSQGFEPYTEEAFDLDYDFFALVNQLAEFLRLGYSKEQLNKFHIYTDPDKIPFLKYKDQFGFNQKTLRHAFTRCALDGLYVFPNCVILMPEMTANSFTEALGRFLFLVSLDQKHFVADDATMFYLRVLEIAAGKIAAKILNPKSESIDLTYFKEVLIRSAIRKRNPGKSTQEKVARLVVEYHQQVVECLAKRHRLPNCEKLIIADLEMDLAISHALGSLLGFGIFQKIVNNHLPIECLRKVFIKKDRRLAITRYFSDLYEKMA